MSLLDEFSINDLRYNRKHYFNKNGQIRPINKDADNLNKQGHLANLHNKSKTELLDLLARQDKLLENRKFISSLADKGEKISKLKVKIEEALKHQEETEAVGNLLSKLDINQPSRKELEGFEWTKEMKSNGVETVEEYDSDDDLPDPLTVLASSTYSGHAVRRKVKEKPLIEAKDVAESHSEYSKDYASVLIAKAENARSDNSKFRPWRSLKHEMKESDTSLRSKPWWEITAATVPSYKYSNAQTISLQESVKLEKEQGEKRKELEMKRAVEKLTGANKSLKVGAYVPTQTEEYRENKADSDDESDEQPLDSDDDVA